MPRASRLARPKLVRPEMGVASATPVARTPGFASPPGTTYPPCHGTRGVVTNGAGVWPAALVHVSVTAWYASTSVAKPGRVTGGWSDTFAPSSPPETGRWAARPAAAGEGAAAAGRGRSAMRRQPAPDW